MALCVSAVLPQEKGGNVRLGEQKLERRGRYPEREESRVASRGGAHSEALLGTLPWMIAPV